MNITIQRFLSLFLSPFLGKKRYQKIFEMLHLFSLAGMNYGVVTPERSGEKYLLENLKTVLLLQKRIIIFDIGANRGEYLQEIINLFDNKAIIYAFEPLKKAHTFLKKKFINRKNIKLLNMGLSDKKGSSAIYYDEDSSQLASLYPRNVVGMTLPAKLSKSEEIKLLTIDDYCQKNKIQKIDLLKIDAEGHELKILNGAKNMIKKSKVNYIQFEFGGPMIDSKTYFRDIYLLLQPNYKIFRMLQDGLVEIKKYQEKQEVFLMSNYFAIRKSLKNI